MIFRPSGIYGPDDAPGATVYDFDAKRDIKHVMLVDLNAGVVTVCRQPPSVSQDGHTLETDELRFQSIVKISCRKLADPPSFFRIVSFCCSGALPELDQ